MFQAGISEAKSTQGLKTVSLPNTPSRMAQVEALTGTILRVMELFEQASNLEHLNAIGHVANVGHLRDIKNAWMCGVFCTEISRSHDELMQSQGKSMRFLLRHLPLLKTM